MFQNKLSINQTQHNISNVEGSVEGNLLLSTLKEFPIAAVLQLQYANMYSTCGAAPTNASKQNTNADKLSSMLDERSQLKEAALGRVATTPTRQNKEEDLGGGALDLQIPPSAETVRVRVLLDFKSSNVQKIKTHSNFNAANVTDKSWLSMKNFQKTISTCDKDNIGAKTDSPQKVDKIKANPCAPKPREESTARRAATACPPCKPKTKFTLIPGSPLIY